MMRGKGDISSRRGLTGAWLPNVLPQGEDMDMSRPSGDVHSTHSVEQSDGVNAYVHYKAEPIKVPIKEPRRVASVPELPNM
jgi:hypothetical protein